MVQSTKDIFSRRTCITALRKKNECIHRKKSDKTTASRSHIKKKYTLIFNKIADTKTGCGLGLLLSLEVQVADLKWDQRHQDGWWRIQ